MNRKEYTLPNGKKAVFEYDFNGIGKVTLECMDELMAMIADRPQEWIPCSERLPEDDELMLVTYVDPRPEAMDIWIGWHEMENVWYIDGEAHSNELGNEVIAWMPLPKPWKGADDDSKRD